MYLYSAVSRSGEAQAGQLEAITRAAAVDVLLRRGMTPLDVSEKTGWLPSWVTQPITWRRAISASDVLAITQELATLLRAGLVLDRALNIAAALAERPAVRRLIEELIGKIRSGGAFADALRDHPHAFPSHYVSMVQAGEMGGSLPEVMLRLARLLDQAQQLKERVRSALIYPAILALMIGATLVLVITVVLPRFERLFLEAQAVLPLPTRIVLALGHLATGYGWLVVLCCAMAVAVSIRLLRAPARRLKWDAALLRRHMLGPLIAKLECARFLRTLGTLITNGIPVPMAIRVANGVFANRALQAATEGVVKSLKEGKNLSVLLAQAGVYPQLAVQLVRVGEETGRLDEMLLEAADILAGEAQTTLERLLAVLVPVLTIGMGLLVAGLIGSVLVGILSVNELAF